MRNRLGILGWGVLAVMTAVACGGSDGGGGGGALSSGVDQSKRGDEVTEEEAAKLCEAVADYAAAKAANVDLCETLGVSEAAIMAGFDEEMTDEQIEEACQQGKQQCQEMLEEGGEEQDCSDTPVPSECSSTVGEIERCIKDQIDMTYEALADVPKCAGLTRDILTSWAENQVETQPPASCETVQEKCPSLLSPGE